MRYELIVPCVAVATGVIIGFVYYRRKQRAKKEPLNRLKAMVTTPRQAIAATLAMLEALHEYDEGMRAAIVRAAVDELVKQGYVPGLRPEHGDPENFDQLLGFLRSRAYPETL